MGFYTSYKAVFDQLEATISAIASIKQTVTGEQFKISSLPLAIINPEDTNVTQGEIGDLLECAVGFSVTIVVRETEPEDWFADVVSVMGDVVDAILNDRTLNGTVKDAIPTFFSPGEITFKNRLYYGGLIRFSALMHYTPS